MTHPSDPKPFNPAYDPRAAVWHAETIASMERDGLYIEGSDTFMPQPERKEEFARRYDRIKNAALVEAAEMADRRTVWSFEVNGTHVRWCGTLEQFVSDCRDYVDASQGEWKCNSKRSYDFHDKATKEITRFRAVRQ